MIVINCKDINIINNANVDPTHGNNDTTVYNQPCVSSAAALHVVCFPQSPSLARRDRRERPAVALAEHSIAISCLLFILKIDAA